MGFPALLSRSTRTLAFGAGLILFFVASPPSARADCYAVCDGDYCWWECVEDPPPEPPPEDPPPPDPPPDPPPPDPPPPDPPPPDPPPPDPPPPDPPPPDPPPPACACAGQNNPYEDADGDCIPGPPFGDDCHDGDCSIGGGCSPPPPDPPPPPPPPPPPACGCAGQNNPYEDADGDCIPGPPFGDDCHDGDCSIGGGCAPPPPPPPPPPPACACAGQNNPYEDADGDCIPGPPFGGDCHDGDCSIGGGCAVCDHNTLCEFSETFASCPSDCPAMCACAGLNNPFEDADGDCIPGPPFGDDCHDGTCAIGGGCAICDNNTLCEFNETSASCPNDCTATACACAGSNNPFEDADGDCIPGPPFGGDCHDGDCSIGGGCPICDNNGLCEFNESSSSCPADCQGGFSVDAGGPYCARAGEAIHFQPRISTASGETVVGYAWDFGDGASSGEAQPLHAYAAEGLYLASLLVTTDTSPAQATTSVRVSADCARDSSEPQCFFFGTCEADSDFAYDELTNVLIPRARFRIVPGTDDFRQQVPALRATIRFNGRSVFETPLVTGCEDCRDKVVQLDFGFFNGLNPLPGSWVMEVSYYYRRVQPGELGPPVLLARDPFPQTVFVCSRGSCQVEPRLLTVFDGGSSPAMFLVNPRPDRSYRWRSRLRATVPNDVPNGPPDARLTPATGTTTSANKPQWVPVPWNHVCAAGLRNEQALNGSRYVVWNEDAVTGTRSSETDLRVEVPWGFRPGFIVFDPFTNQPHAALTSPPTPAPSLRRLEDIPCDATTCRLDVTALLFVRVGGDTVYATGFQGSGSRFFTKVEAHERDHIDFWTNPDRCGAKYFTEASLRARLIACAADESPSGCHAPVGGDVNRARMDVVVKMFAVQTAWALDETNAFSADGMVQLLESEAYEVSDRLEPMFLYQNKNSDGSIKCFASPTPCAR